MRKRGVMPWPDRIPGPTAKGHVAGQPIPIFGVRQEFFPGRKTNDTHDSSQGDSGGVVGTQIFVMRRRKQVVFFMIATDVRRWRFHRRQATACVSGISSPSGRGYGEGAFRRSACAISPSNAVHPHPGPLPEGEGQLPSRPGNGLLPLGNVAGTASGLRRSSGPRTADEGLGTRFASEQGTKLWAAETLAFSTLQGTIA